MNMHLHGHIASCIRDYGPVYAFWCFAFERMNGILGSYHTNNRNISIQLANRFLDSKAYAPSKWPAEFRGEYLPLLERFLYSKGSLMQRTVETEFSSGFVTALPPLKESSFQSWECESLKSIFDTCTVLQPNSYDVLILHKRAKALLVGQFVFGAKKTNHSRSSLALSQRTLSSSSAAHSSHLAEILFFVCAVAVSKIDSSSTCSLWFAAVSWFMEHQCKVWFGHPTQVWSTATYPGYCYIPVSDLKSGVIYSKAVVNFGRIIGEDSVYVITPLEVQ